jgi:hypothetical protein
VDVTWQTFSITNGVQEIAVGEIIIEDNKADGTKDYGTNCRDCERYKRVGEVCVLEHGKRHLSDYCRDFEQIVHLPDYNELMKSVKQDMAAQRQKEREKKERERKQKQKERDAKKEERRRKRISRARKRYLAIQKKKERERARGKEAGLKTSLLGANKKVSAKSHQMRMASNTFTLREMKPSSDSRTIPFSQSSFVLDDSKVNSPKKPKRKNKAHSSKTPRTASSASATA